jgi:GMP synthase (glutamine-hydrolysing)
MIHIHVIQHESFESPAAIENWFSMHKCRVTYTHVYNYETFPSDVSSIDMLFVMGGPQSPQSTREEFPYFDGPAEIQFVKRVIDAGKKVVGICLGAQIIGEALGAAVVHSPNREIGAFEIHKTPAALTDEVCAALPDKFMVGHWHGDMPGLTAQSEVLAYSQGCPRQIVRFTPNVYGFQCHLEFTSQAIAGMIQNCGDELRQFSGFPYVWSAQQLQNYRYTEMNEVLFRMLDIIVAKQ